MGPFVSKPSYSFKATQQPNQPSWIANPNIDSLNNNNNNINSDAAKEEKHLLSPNALSLAQFNLTKVVGKGKFGVVTLAQFHPQSQTNAKGKYYAIKTITKTPTMNITSVQNEIKTLLSIRHPFILHGYGYFQDPTSVHIITPFVACGEFYSVILSRQRQRSSSPFTSNETLFYILQLAVVLGFLHTNVGVVYRDLKPENVCVDYYGYLKVIDFGFCTSVVDSNNVDGNCGTAMYLSPEILNTNGNTSANMKHKQDYWALGIIAFTLLTGASPFGDTDELSKFEIFTNISTKNIKWRGGGIGSDVKSVVEGLLNKNPAKRFEFKDIVSSDWFLKSGVVIEKLCKREYIAPWAPWINGGGVKEGDTSCFLDWGDDSKSKSKKSKKRITVLATADDNNSDTSPKDVKSNINISNTIYRDNFEGGKNVIVASCYRSKNTSSNTDGSGEASELENKTVINAKNKMIKNIAQRRFMKNDANIGNDSDASSNGSNTSTIKTRQSMSRSQSTSTSPTNRGGNNSNASLRKNSQSPTSTSTNTNRKLGANSPRSSSTNASKTAVRNTSSSSPRGSKLKYDVTRKNSKRGGKIHP